MASETCVGGVNAESIFDERPHAFRRVVPLRRDLVEIPLGSIQALAVQVTELR